MFTMNLCSAGPRLINTQTVTNGHTKTLRNFVPASSSFTVPSMVAGRTSTPVSTAPAITPTTPMIATATPIQILLDAIVAPGPSLEDGSPAHLARLEPLGCFLQQHRNLAPRNVPTAVRLYFTPVASRRRLARRLLSRERNGQED